jgi:MFS family permease
MENLILGWYVLVETGSVMMLTLFASLQYVGTLIAPVFGVMGDRLGHRNVLCGMRAFYATLASIIMALAFAGVLSPIYALMSAGLLGLVKPSDIGMRAALVADTMPRPQLVGAMGIQRTTQDSAKIMGALSGAGIVALVGIAPAYLVVATLYTSSVLLTLKAGAAGRAARGPLQKLELAPAGSPWRDLREGLRYVRRTPHLLAVMCLAFLLNLTAFPLFNGLLPVVAKTIYLTDQRGLGFMAAGASFGALIGSIVLSRYGSTIQPARVMVVGGLLWYSFLIVFANTPYQAPGIAVLVIAGFAQSISQVPMAAVLLRSSDEHFRGRVMGIRMLAIYSNIPGLLIAGPLIASIGYPATATAYCVFGIVFAAAITVRWRAHLWRREAPANVR